MQERSLRKSVLKRHTALLNERSGYDTHWQSVQKNLLPRVGRFGNTRRNQGRSSINGDIIDSTGTQALRTLAAGMMSGMTSPARPWFRLTTPDTELADSDAVKDWLYIVQQKMLRVFARSNTYNALHQSYRELGGFGTSASVLVPSYDTVIHHHPQTVGEYCLDLNHLGFVSTFTREFELSVLQTVEWFGLDKVSRNVKNAYDTCKYEQRVTIVHVIEPRHERDGRYRDNLNMPWRDVYIEKAGSDIDPVLQESGHREFPVLTPRWDVLWNDSYGSGPGFDALGDMLQLQHQQLMKAKAIDYKSDPPLQLPTQLRNQESDLLPGGTTYFDSFGPNTGIRTAFEVQLDINELREDIMDVRQRIQSAFYSDMFLMLSNIDKSGMTATEVAERHEEKLLMLGPVLERLHNELLSPLIESTFARMIETGMVPPPPEELGGMDLDVEYVSMLAQAQKAIGVNSTDRLLGHLGQLANVKPEVVDKYNADLSIERYADQLGVDPDLIVADDQVAMIRSERAQAQAAQAQAEQAEKMAGALGKMGQVPTDGGGSNAGADLINMFSGYGSPSGVEL